MGRPFGETLYTISQDFQKNRQLRQKEQKDALERQLLYQKLSGEIPKGFVRLPGGDIKTDPTYPKPLTPYEKAMYQQMGLFMGGQPSGASQQPQFPPDATVDPDTGDVYDASGRKIGNVNAGGV